MTKTKHTPANWNVKWVMRAENRVQVSITFEHEFNAEEMNANLNLVAAAPDLYNALDKLLSVAKVPIFEAGHPNEIKNALLALAKARGET
jgi:hypothetical protein